MRFCKQCGAQLSEGAAFCPSCGVAIPADVQQASSAQSYERQYEQYQQPRQQYAPAQQPEQPQYKQPAQAVPAPPAQSEYDKVMSVGRFLGVLLLMSIPAAGFILQIVWACGGCENLNLRNFARAYLLFTLIVTVLAIIIAVIFGGIFAGALPDIYY